MKQIKNRILYMAAAGLAILMVCLPQAVMAQEGTQGDELHVIQAEKLEIQLGPDWSGVQFQLKTDAGLYPGTITVGEDGVLRTELGGSKNYILTCLDSPVEAPALAQVPATTEESPKVGSRAAEAEAERPRTLAGIPVPHIILFSGGMLLAIGCLVAMHVLKKSRESEEDYEDEEDE